MPAKTKSRGYKFDRRGYVVTDWHERTRTMPAVKKRKPAKKPRSAKSKSDTGTIKVWVRRQGRLRRILYRNVRRGERYEIYKSYWE